MKGFSKNINSNNPTTTRNSGSSNKRSTVKQDVDEFWNDCINVDVNNQSGIGVNSNPNESVNEYITFKNSNQNLNPQMNPQNNSTQNTLGNVNMDPPSFENHKGLTKSNSNKIAENLSPKQKKYMNLIQKYSFDHLWTKEDLALKQQEELKKKKSMERCYLLYEKGKIKNEVNRIMYHKNEELKVQNELKECTWKPKLNAMNKKMEENLKIMTKDTKIYNRGIKWKIKNNQKINRNKSDMQREILENTYKPNINLNPNLSQVFDDNRTIFNDHSNRSFVFRYGKAREEEEDKKKRIVPDLSRQVKDKWSKANLNRSCSMTERDSTNIKQTLRDELHSIKYADSDEN